MARLTVLVSSESALLTKSSTALTQCATATRETQLPPQLSRPVEHWMEGGCTERK